MDLGVPLQSPQGSQALSRVETGQSGNFLSCSKVVKNPFKVQEGRCDLPQEASAEKGLISPGVENRMNFIQLHQISLE